MKLKAVSGIMLTLLLAGMLILTYNIQPAKTEALISANAGEPIYSWIDNPTPLTSNSTLIWAVSPTNFGIMYVLPGLSVDLVVTISNDPLSDTAWDCDGLGFGGWYPQYGDFDFVMLPPQIDPGNSWTGTIGNFTVNSTTPLGTQVTDLECSLEIYAISGAHPEYYRIPITIISGLPIRIKVDGSVEPSTANIESVDNITYTFTDNIYESIVVERSNIIIDGNGHTLQGPWGIYGFYLSGINNVTIQNTNIKSFSHGIDLYQSSNTTISANKITNNGYGIWLENSSNNSISGNNITNNGYGIYLIYSSNNSVKGNGITNNDWHGVLVSLSSNNSISGNNITENYNHGIELCHANNSIIYGNTITNNYHGIQLYESANNSVSGNNITANNWDGIRVYFSSNSTVSGNTITNNNYGIRLQVSPDNTLRNNDASNNTYNFGVYGSSLSHYIQDIDESNTVNRKPVYYWIDKCDMDIPLDAGYVALINCKNITGQNLNLTNNGQGILLAFTTNSVIAGNTITNNVRGIRFFSSSNNTLQGNNITNNGYGIEVYAYSNYNTISGNNITNNNCGVGLYSSSTNTISANKITNNWNGIWLENSSNNSISGNNITENYARGIELYWYSNYNTISGNTITANNLYGIRVDVSSNNIFSGNDITNNVDGIYLFCSSNNTFFHNNFVDNGSCHVHSYESPNVWDNGYPSGGNYWSDHNPSDLYSGPHQNETGSDGIGDIHYIIDGNNKDRYPLIYPYGYVPSPDMNNDEIIDILDGVIIGVAFGSRPGDPNWDPMADIETDGIIDIMDVLLWAVHFGETW